MLPLFLLLPLFLPLLLLSGFLPPFLAFAVSIVVIIKRFPLIILSFPVCFVIDWLVLPPALIDRFSLVDLIGWYAGCPFLLVLLNPTYLLIIFIGYEFTTVLLFLVLLQFLFWESLQVVPFLRFLSVADLQLFDVDWGEKLLTCQAGFDFQIFKFFLARFWHKKLYYLLLK